MAGSEVSFIMENQNKKQNTQDKKQQSAQNKKNAQAQDKNDGTQCK